MVMLRLFPVMFPQYWGPPSLNFAPVGFAAEYEILLSGVDQRSAQGLVARLRTELAPLAEGHREPPYPYAVDDGAAAQGAELFAKYCATCHHDGNAAIFPTSEVGTDPNRAIIWTPYTVGALRAVLVEACTDPVTCDPGGSPPPATDVVNPTGGYMALPLGGIWARAPYLHNGSVPTLAALLTKQRPAKFYRGNITYDTVDVGFASTSAVTPFAAVYDTTLSGNSNVGHSSPEFLGPIDWAKSPRELHAILEYMKTL